MSVRELRAELADVINAAGMHDQITFVTSRGRRVAAVVSVAVAQGAEEVRQADGDQARRRCTPSTWSSTRDWEAPPA